MRNKIIISTLICTYNAQKFFHSTIRSVLDQTYKDQEILIWDDNSTDNTINILKEWAAKDNRIKLFIQPGIKKGSYGGLNFLLEQAKGKYIAIQDHDDIWHPRKLHEQVDFLEKNNAYSGCGTKSIYYYEKYNIAILHNKKSGDTTSVQHSSLMFHNKSKYRYNPNWKVGCDTYFMKRVLGGKLSVINYIGLTHRRRKNGNLSNIWSKNITGRWKMYKHGLISFKQFLYYIYSGRFSKIQLYLSINFFSNKRVKKGIYHINKTKTLR